VPTPEKQGLEGEAPEKAQSQASLPPRKIQTWDILPQSQRFAPLKGQIGRRPYLGQSPGKAAAAQRPGSLSLYSLCRFACLLTEGVPGTVHTRRFGIGFAICLGATGLVSRFE
jgi:hypothetical protein